MATQRLPLAEIGSNRAHNTELPNGQNGMIIGRRREGASLQKIADSEHLHKSTEFLSCFVNATRLTGSGAARYAATISSRDDSTRHVRTDNRPYQQPRVVDQLCFRFAIDIVCGKTE